MIIPKLNKHLKYLSIVNNRVDTSSTILNGLGIWGAKLYSWHRANMASLPVAQLNLLGSYLTEVDRMGSLEGEIWNQYLHNLNPESIAGILRIFGFRFERLRTQGG